MKLWMTLPLHSKTRAEVSAAHMRDLLLFWKGSRPVFKNSLNDWHRESLPITISLANIDKHSVPIISLESPNSAFLHVRKSYWWLFSYQQKMLGGRINNGRGIHQ